MGVLPSELVNRSLTTSGRSHHVPAQSYKEQFLRAQQEQAEQQRQQEKRIMGEPRVLTRDETLMSIADAICPPSLRSEIESPNDALATPRGGGHPVSLHAR